jgi:hypothetical protein
MYESNDDELTPEERAAFAALPREQMPSRLLAERTVRALRERGLLLESRRPWLPASWRVAAAAAALALFAGGTAFGQWLSARQTASTVASLRTDDPLAAALRVQRAGSAYLDALSALVDASDGADARTATQAREVALAVFRGAADEIERLQRPESARGEGEVSHVIWF